VFLLHIWVRIVGIFFLVTLLNGLTASVTAQENQSSLASERITWSKQVGVSHYRLQIATDSQFNDVVFDRRINGSEYVVRDLPPGRYYWRVAQAETKTGEFLTTVAFEVKTERTIVPRSTPSIIPTVPTIDTSVRTRRTVHGWSVATGDVVRLLAARLRLGAARDFIGVSSDGTVYGLQGSRGIALWTAHFHLDNSGAKRVRSYQQQFSPLIVNIGGSSPAVIVAFDQGTRAIDGASGREIWNTRTGGRPSVGAIMERPGRSNKASAKMNQ
jgi:hypothetical protein